MFKFIPKKLTSFAVSMSLIGIINAQNPHFSQFYTFASQLNPSLVGNYDGSYRVAAVYRNQWSSALQQSGYTTIGAEM